MTTSLIGVLGYGLCALLFTLLGLVLLTGWRGRLQGGLLVFAVFTSALWAGFLAWQATSYTLPIEWIWICEAFRNLAWVLFLIRLLEVQAAGHSARTRLLRRVRFGALMVTLLLVLPLNGFGAWVRPWIGVEPGVMRLVFALLIAVAGLVLIEQVFRNTPWQHRWGIKYLCLGVGGLFAFDFFFFADALLFQRLDQEIWLARGAASVLAAPLIGISAARNPQWSFDLLVSRTAVFHSTALFAAGVYLLVMALVGYYIRYYGGAWSAAIQMAFFFGAGMVLVVLLFSGHLRSRLKVFVSKHFFTHRYDYREEWLRLIDVLSGRALQATLPQRVVFALAELVDSPGGVLWLRNDGGRYEHARAWNLAEATVDKGTDMTQLAAFLEQRHAVINLGALRRDPDAYDGFEVPAGLLADERLWLIVPLQHDDALLGFVILVRPRAPQVVNWEVMDMLTTAGRQASSYLALDRAARALAVARQFEGFNRLSAFVVHDLKNLIAQLSLVVKNAERHRQNPAFVDDAIDTIKHSVDKMSRLLAQLRDQQQRAAGSQVDLRLVVTEVVRARAVQHPVPVLDMAVQIPLNICVDPDRLTSVISHVVQNAQEATSREGRVVVRLQQSGAAAVIEVCDDGVGMDADFVRERLFTPFDSTKGLTGMGIGAYEAREFIVSIGGQVFVESAPGHGTVFRILVPAEGVEAQAEFAVSAG
ncbi:XrtA/PEP-CTERM system histidine kinase PrsK [uncultured Lamprocystis sp.]|jgi:putative PEP-CTERM system histidine kinase|uniref:XrtA/PEP-CTERM system histidine kinase PrsK n=1 Tax=uncultured Lamprocystis sp. TaxID=543132 RepID=UPI0025E26386|nr:XrtA/PEP-CTERM system histidine kinase PrsK [uncultured Lamprocystis sp.]